MYDERTGDPESGIAPGTIFTDLPKEYSCALCEAPKEDFKKIEKGALGLQSV
ncbi:MAG: rubredoxin [Chitinophagaceae bacterium]|nr:rubredoxin [Chitinophagaceae bacterium]